MRHQHKIECTYNISRSFNDSTSKQTISANISCEKCENLYKNDTKSLFNGKCFRNLIKIFINNLEITEVVLKTANGVINLTKNQIQLFLNYGQFIDNIYSKLKIPLFEGNKGCIRNFECNHKRNFFWERIFGNKFNDGIIFSDPILTYNELNQEIKIFSQIQNENPDCQECFKSWTPFFKKIRNLISQTLIIEKYLLLYDTKAQGSKIYTTIFGDYNIDYLPLSIKSRSLEINERILTSYKKGPYGIKILEDIESKDHFYLISPISENPSFKKIYDEIINELKNGSRQYFDYNQPHKLNYLLQYELNYLNYFIKQKYGNFTVDQISALSEIIVFELLNFNPLMAFLIDDEIEEIFLDSPKSNIYLDHRDFGRCQTNISLTPTEIESLKTRIRIEAEQRLDETQPFLKTEIITDYFHIRISIQIHPLSIDGFSLSIRKLRKKELTLIDLIKNKTLTIEAASFLLYNFIHGRCILVIGEPYSGKTTLINSLDLLGKKNWRKIYIEDVIESIDQHAFNIHQVRYQVTPPLGNTEIYSAKSFQVKECLHRTPDAIFIGEIIYPESAHAFFFLLKVGLRRCLATSHGESPELMVERFLYDDHIPAPLIENLDIIVQMNRTTVGGKIIRRVTRIVEIEKKIHNNNFNENFNENKINNFTFVDIFTRDPKIDTLLKLYNSYNELYLKSENIKKINSLKGENISEADLKMELKKIKSLLEQIIKEKIDKTWDIVKKISLFMARIRV